MAADMSAETPSRSLAARLASCLNEGVIGFLALVAFATALGPLVFDLSPAVDRALQALEWIVVGAFALEFVVQLAAAEDKAAWLRSPWRLLDVITIVGPLAALLPSISDAASGSLALRLLRVGRAVAFGTRAGSAAARRQRGPWQTAVASTPKVACITDFATLQPTDSDWGACLAWARNPGPAWFHATQVSPGHFLEAARCAGIDLPGLKEAYEPNAPARLQAAPGASTLFLWIPTVAEEGFPAVSRVRIASVVTEQGLLTATPETFDLMGSVSRLAARVSLPSHPFPIRLAPALLALARDRFQFTAQRFDEEARQFEAIPIMEGGRKFLEETSRLRREISATALDLGQLRGIVRALADGRTTIRGVDLSKDEFLDNLANETDTLHERLTGLKEDVQSVIELHIHVKSFEMNKILKLLAIVTFLGLIPSITGGMLGMNVAGNPWSVTLGQVAFCVGMAGATALYVFAMKGWLR